jgi:hypothetical protein
VNVLVLVSFGLVLLATILLVVGLLTDDGLTLIYFSIAASFTAAVVLYLAFRRARPKADPNLEPPAPIAPEGAEAEADEPTTLVPATTTPEAVVAAAEEPEQENEPEPVLASEPGAGAANDDDWTTDDDWADDGEFDVEFPIADYDDLTVAEIMPLLPQLYSDELGVVAERERKGKKRATILNRLDELAATGTEADVLEGETLDAEPEPMPEAADAAAAAVGSRDETLATSRPAAPAPQVPSLSDDDAAEDFVFPIADYDELSVDQIVPLLAQLEDDELQDVKAREAAGQGRKTVIAEIDRQMGLVEAADTGFDLDDAGWADEVPAADGRSTPEAESAEGSVLAIAGYDGLTVAQIRPLLVGLSDDELRAVLEHEVARDNRRTIVNDIERRLDAPEPEPAAAPAATTKTATRATKARARKTAAKQTPARKATKKAATKKKSTRKKSAAKKSARATKKAAASRFPIADYDTLTVAKIRPQLADLDDDQLRQVQAREESGAGRKTILNDIASRLG